MTETDQKLLALRIELLELEVARQKQPAPSESPLHNPVVLAIVGAIGTALVAFATSQVQLYANRQLERDKLESSLILKSLDTADANQRIVGLTFLVKAGLISDDNGKIRSLTADEVPQIQESASPPTAKAEAGPLQDSLFVSEGWVYFGQLDSNDQWQDATVEGLTGEPRPDTFYLTKTELYVRDNHPSPKLGETTDGVKKGVWLLVADTWRNSNTGSVWCKVKVVTDKVTSQSPPKIPVEGA